MTILDRYLIKRLAVTLIAVLASLVALFILVDLLTHRQESIASNDVPLNVLLRYYLAYVPTILFEFQFLPMAILVATLVVFGRLAEFNEITAFLASGVSIHRIAGPPIFGALLVALLAFAVGETLGVRANVAEARLEANYFGHSQGDERAGVSWMDLEGGWVCHLKKYNRIARTGEGVVLHRFYESGMEEIQAGRIVWDEENVQWLLEDGYWSVMQTEPEYSERKERITQMVAPFDEHPDELFALDKPPRLKSAWDLSRDIKFAEGRGVAVQTYWVDYHAKFARPGLCFVMVLLAIPFAIRLRRGGLGAGVGISLLIGLAYTLLFLATVRLGHLNLLNPIVAAWLPNVVFGGAGGVLLWKMPT